MDEDLGGEQTRVSMAKRRRSIMCGYGLSMVQNIRKGLDKEWFSGSPDI